MFWSVEKLLTCLKSWHPIENLTLKQMTIKTASLIALSSSDRGQTLNLMSIDRMHIGESVISFVITERLKTTRRRLKPKVVTVPVCSDEALNPKLYVQEYLVKTAQFRRPEHNKLFLSWATKRPVTKPTLARWLKHALREAGIDTSVYSAHSYRGSSLSAAFAKGISLEKIVKAGDWTNVNTFKAHYLAHNYDSPVGQIILNEYNHSSGKIFIFV